MNLIEKVELHSSLNPKFWNNFELHEDIHDNILAIVEEFNSTLDIKLNIVDIRIVGSQASYNYTNTSDLDVHIVANFDTMDASQEILAALYNSAKTRFNSEYAIKIKGVEVELYVEDMNSTIASNGIYSVLKDTWIKKPSKIEPIMLDTSKSVDKWSKRIHAAIKSNNPELIERVIDALYLLRKNGIETGGEFSLENQIFKDIRNNGLLDELKVAYKKSRSKELSLENYRLTEASRASLLNKSKQSKKGFERFKKRVKSRVANTVKQYNSIDMNKLFKQDILTVDINVKGETDTYQVKISFGGVCELIKDQIKRLGEFNLKAVTRALITGLNREDVYIHCSCPDASYRMNYWQTKNKITSGDAETRPSDITNPNDSLGAGCKHVLLVLSNTSWLLKVSSTIFNYINYMEKHYSRLYAHIIYPAIYGKKYEEPVQLDLFDNEDTLDTDKETIDKSNQYAVDKTKFQKGNTQGIRFTSTKKEPDQISVDEAPLDDDI